MNYRLFSNRGLFDCKASNDNLLNTALFCAAILIGQFALGQSSINNSTTLKTIGLKHGEVYQAIHDGNFMELPFNREDMTFVSFIRSYGRKYSERCLKSLPSNSIPWTEEECIRGLQYPDGTIYTCYEYRTDTTHWLSPEMYAATVEVGSNYGAAGLVGDMFKSLKDGVGAGLGGLLQDAFTADEYSKDFVLLINQNGCSSSALKRFEANLIRFSMNKQPLTNASTKVYSNKQLNTFSNNLNNSKYAADYVNDLIYANSQSWSVHRYRGGSASNVRTNRSSSNRVSSMKADYVYIDFGGNKRKGSVNIIFSPKGLPECLYFHDNPSSCKTPDRAITHQYISNAINKEQAILRQEEFDRRLDLADQYFRQKEYELAKPAYENALKLIPSNLYAKDKVNFINEYNNFQIIKDTKTFDYKKDVGIAEYTQMSTQIIDEITNAIESSGIVGKVKVAIILTFDQRGSQQTRLQQMGSDNNKTLLELIENVVNNQNLNQPKLFDYAVKAEAQIPLDIDIDEQLIEGKKMYKKLITNGANASQRNRIEHLLSTRSYGKYDIQFIEGKVNRNTFRNERIVGYTNTGGPSNAFKSLIIPGAGRKAVTYGEKTGKLTTSYTYIFLAAGVGSKIYSLAQYRNYQNATEQKDIDEFYQAANVSNQVFLGCIAAGLTIWSLDIITTAAKGFGNLKYGKKEKDRLGLSFHSNLVTHGLSLTYKF